MITTTLLLYIKNNYRLLAEIVITLIAIVSMYLVIHTPRYAEKITDVSIATTTVQSTTTGNYDDVIVTDTEKKKDGTVKIHKEEHKKKKVVVGTDVQAKITETKTIIKSLSRYSLDITQDFPDYNFNQKYLPENTRMTFGIRVGDLPLFGLVGSTGDFRTLSLGLRIEF